MDNPPFKTQGIYVRRINPEIELTNYKSSKLDQIWKVATGRKEGDYYTIINFKEKLDLSKGLITTPIKYYNAGYSLMEGELLDLVDYFKKKPSSYCEYKNVFYRDSYVRFEEDSLIYTCVFDKDLFTLEIVNRDIGKSAPKARFRYIPWI
jgi:hypothetical protein